MMDWQKATRAIALGRPPHAPGAPLNVAPQVASMFRAGGERLYARESGTPGWEALEEVIGSLEGGAAVTFASGMAAVTAVVQTSRWSAIVLPDGGYNGTRALCETLAQQSDLPVRPVDVTDVRATLEACERSALLWLESPTNPLLQVADLAAISAGARERGCTVVVDNTFATPLVQTPLALGADYVVHSATKYLSGHSDATLGAVVCAQDRAERLRAYRGLTGAIPGAIETYLVLRGMRTLPLRFERAQQNAAALAEHLSTHPRASNVRYPGFGGMIAFELSSAAEADALCESVRLIVHATSLGGVETTMERRSKYASEAHLPPGFIRMSVGCEDAGDLWNDLRAALDATA